MEVACLRPAIAMIALPATQLVYDHKEQHTTLLSLTLGLCISLSIDASQRYLALNEEAKRQDIEAPVSLLWCEKRMIE